MKKKIYLENKTLEYDEIIFKRGLKSIDIPKSKSNLLLFANILDKNKIFFGLVYGTLLGAIRENNFIAHDEDTDVYILDEDREKFLNILVILLDNGFVIGRYTNDLLSIVKDGEYIDIYIYSKYRFGYRKCENMIIKDKYLIDTIEYKFLDYNFNIPKEYTELLVYLYGPNWKIPKKHSHAANYKFSTKIKYFFKNNFKFLVKIKYFLLKYAKNK